MKAMVLMGSDTTDAENVATASSVAIIDVLNACAVHHNPEIALKALSMLSSSLDFSVKHISLTGCNFTNHEGVPYGTPSVNRDNDMYDNDDDETHLGD